MKEYLDNFWSDLEAADLLYKSLSSSDHLVSEKGELLNSNSNEVSL